MTTQTTIIELSGPNKSRRFTATSTDAQFNEQKSTVGTLSLGDVMKGETITHAAGQLAAGIAIGRIRNTVNDQVKGYIMCDVIGEEIMRKLRRPIKVEENDIVEVYCDVA